ncbi:MAG: hypothetical protein WBE42_28190, partial [Pseudolabrys sp.]
AHCDEEALIILFRHNPKARIIWAHTGFSVPPARVAQLLDEHKDALWGEYPIAAAFPAAMAS